MTPTQGLIIGLVVAFSAGVYVGRVQHEPVRDFPSNLDVAAALQGEKSSKAEAAAYQALLTKAIEGCGAPVQETAH